MWAWYVLFILLCSCQDNYKQFKLKLTIKKCKKKQQQQYNNKNKEGKKQQQQKETKQTKLNK